jgi:acyl carrier protein
MGLDSVELVMNTEKHFGIEIPDDVAETLFTVGDLHGFIVAELGRNGREQNPDTVFVELRQLICDQFGINPERVVAEARIVKDLGID